MSLSRPYTYTDGQNHRLAIGTTPDPHGVLHVSIEANNLAWGGDSVAVWLTASQARALDSHLAAATPTLDIPASAGGKWQITDRTDDMLTVRVAHDFTTFEITRAACESQGATAVRVVALTGRLPELRRALGNAIQAAEKPSSSEAAPAELPGRRVLTESEYSSAWHAVEGAAGEVGADPATILYAVLRALDIAAPPRTT
ncbi:hypothetical protein [Streptomyces anulatus]|uniref:hypothetical protein n=1 Tax=Streptomyces anulatus TaxID=1892 RepID=UPI00365EFA1F